MADSDDADFPDVPPPEVPDEFAAAYREAYRRALEEGSAPAAAADPELPDVPGEPVSPSSSPQERVTEYRAGTPVQHLRETAWFVPVVAVLLVLALVLAGWLVARVIGGDDEATAPPTERPRSTPSPSSSPKASSTPEPDRPAPYRGKVDRVTVSAVSATCTLEPGVDSAGRKVDYAAENAVDGDPTTAWRCEGDAVGTRIALRLPAGTEIAEVGLVPGYAKTDPASGADRYAENNRIALVRWKLAKGLLVQQRLDPAADRRDLQLLRVPKTATGQVVLEILAVERGSRGATAISEIRLAAPRA